MKMTLHRALAQRKMMKVRISSLRPWQCVENPEMTAIVGRAM